MSTETPELPLFLQDTDAASAELRPPFNSALPPHLQRLVQASFDVWAADGNQSIEALACIIANNVYWRHMRESDSRIAELTLIQEAEVKQLRDRLQVMPSVVVEAVMRSLGASEVTIDFNQPATALPTISEAGDGRWTYTLPTQEQPS